LHIAGVSGPHKASTRFLLPCFQNWSPWLGLESHLTEAVKRLWPASMPAIHACFRAVVGVLLAMPAANSLRLPAGSRREALEGLGQASVGLAALLQNPANALAQARKFPDRDPNIGPQDYLTEVDPNAPPLNIIMTGASSGIGRDAAAKLVKRGHIVTVPCRTMEKAEEVCRMITAEAEAYVPGAGVGRAVPMVIPCPLAMEANRFLEARRAPSVGLRSCVLE